MEVEFQNSKEDILYLYKTQLNKSFKRLIPFYFVLCTLLAFWLYNDRNTYSHLYIVTCISIIIIAAAASYFLPLWFVIIKINSLTKNKKIVPEKKKIVILDNGIKRIAPEKEDALYKWDSITNVIDYGKLISIKLVGGKSFLIPRISFKSEADVINFLGEIRAKITLTNNTGSVVYSKDGQKSNPPYWLGFLGVIPFVGAIVGVILIINGIFKYKNIALIILGTIGIGFTILVYNIFPSASDMMKDKQTRKAFAEFSKDNLNSLVKEIEFYKIQNGIYPDSLQQIDTKGSLTNIYDPLLSGQKNRIFNYHKIGAKYTLFSSGEDQKPNTADDIYPTIDTTHIGLIIKVK